MNWFLAHWLHLIAATPLVLILCGVWKELLGVLFWLVECLIVVWGVAGLFS